MTPRISADRMRKVFDKAGLDLNSDDQVEQFLAALEGEFTSAVERAAATVAHKLPERNRTMDENDSQKIADSVMRANGLDPKNAEHSRVFLQEYQEEASNPNGKGVKKFKESGDPGIAMEQAARRAATRLGREAAGPRVRTDTRTPQERWLETLPPDERKIAVNRMTGNYDKEAEAAQQQAGLRERFLAEVKEKGVDYSRGNAIRSDVVDSLASKYKRLGLNNVTVARADEGQTDEALAADLAKRAAKNPRLQEFITNQQQGAKHRLPDSVRGRWE